MTRVYYRDADTLHIFEADDHGRANEVGMLPVSGWTDDAVLGLALSLEAATNGAAPKRRGRPPRKATPEARETAPAAPSFDSLGAKGHFGVRNGVRLHVDSWRLYDAVVAEPGLRGPEYMKRIGRKQSPHLWAALHSHGLVRREGVNNGARWFPA